MKTIFGFFSCPTAGATTQSMVAATNRSRTGMLNFRFTILDPFIPYRRCTCKAKVGESLHVAKSSLDNQMIAVLTRHRGETVSIRSRRVVIRSRRCDLAGILQTCRRDGLAHSPALRQLDFF